MIDRGRPVLFVRRSTWLAALSLSAALGAAGTLAGASSAVVALAGLPLALAALGFLGVMLLAGLLGSSWRNPLHRVSECCPWCRRERPVRYRCPGCGAWHDDLRPGWYGLWHARCGVCRRELATTERGGRAGYARSCGNPDCGHGLPATIGRCPEYHIALVGREAHWLVPMLRRLDEQYLAPNQVALQFIDAEEERAVRAGEELRQLTVLLRMANGQESLLFLSDLTSAGPTQRFLAVSRLDGLLFVIDPPPAAAATISDVPGPAGRRFALTTAILARAPAGSAGPPAHDLTGPFVNVEAAVQEAFRDSALVRDHLTRLGLGAFVGALERRFIEVGYFAVDAPAAGRGLATPLAWLLGRTDALTDRSLAGRTFGHCTSYLRRVWLGDEGDVLVGCWLGVYFVLLVFVLFACVWSCLGRFAFFTVLVAAAAGLWWGLYRQLRPEHDD